MELAGHTVKFTYTNSNLCQNAAMDRTDKRYAIPLPTARWSPHQLPWRSSQYVTPENVSCGAMSKHDFSLQEQQQVEYQNQRFSNDNTVSMANPTFCKPCQFNRGVFFPYRNVIIGSKLIMLPDKEAMGNKIQTNTDSNIPVANNITNSLKYVKTDPCEQPRDMSGPDFDSERPVTPPLGRSAWLDQFIQFKLKSGTIKSASTQTCSPYDQATHQAIENRIKNLNKNTQTYNIPMSHFKSDDRFLRNAYRTYKRDTELLKERCQYTDPKMYADVGNMDWYNDMMANPTSLDVRTESALLCSDFVPVQDALGGCCYLDSKKKVDNEQLKHDIPCKDAFLSLICEELRPSVVTAKRRPPIAKSAFQCSIDDNLDAINIKVNNRNRLLTMLASTEQSMQETKIRYYRLPEQERNSTQFMREIHQAETSRRNLLLQLGSTERTLDEMMRHQHVLESQLAQHLLETSLITSSTLNRVD